MAYILQHRRDTLANWNKVNPILADAEIGFILDKDENGKQKSSLYKIGDGKTPWNDLPLFGFGGNVYNNFKGNDLSTSVASRQAILDKFNELNEELDASLVQSISPEEEESEDIMKQQVVSRWALLEEFQNIWGDVRGNKEQINSLVVDVPGLKDNVTSTMEKVEGLEKTSNTHSGEIEALRTDTNNLITDMGFVEKDIYGWTEENGEESIEHKGLKDIVEKHTTNINTLQALPKSIIMSNVEFDNLQQDVVDGQARYEENALYFIYEDEINQ